MVDAYSSIRATIYNRGRYIYRLHGEITPGSCRYRGPISGVVDNKQNDDDDNDDEYSDDEGTDAPGHRAEHLSPFADVVASLVVDVGENVADDGADHAVETAGTQQARDDVPGANAPRPGVRTLASSCSDCRFLLLCSTPSNIGKRFVYVTLQLLHMTPQRRCRHRQSRPTA